MHSARHTKSTCFMALCISNTPTLGIQRQVCWHFCCTGMCVQRAPHERHNFFGIVHCIRTHTRYPKALLIARLVQTYVPLARRTIKHAFFGIVHFKHTHTRYPKTLGMALLVQIYVRAARRTKNTHILALCISNSYILCIQRHVCWQCGEELCAFAVPQKKHIFGHCAVQTHPY